MNRRLIYIIVSLLAVCAPGTAMAVPLMPSGLRVNDVVDPVGTDATPYFGWFVKDPSPGAIQTCYQIRIATSASALADDLADVWDSGVVESGRQNHVSYDGPALNADTRYYWQVRTWDAFGRPGPFSAIANFTVGLLGDQDWSGAVWVRRETQDVDDYTYYRKQTTLPAKTVQRATAYVTGVHKYTLSVNGITVGQGPAYHYPQFQYYNGWDITSLVATGGPTVFAVFNHWFGGGQGRPASERGVILKVIVHYTDGSTIVVGTDGTWKQAKAYAWEVPVPVHRRESEGVGYVERIDARRMMSGWNGPGFDDSTWAPVTVLGPHPTAPWIGVLASDLSRLDESEISPVSILDQGEGNYLVDFGRVYAAVPRITFAGGTPGHAVNLRGGYALTPSGAIDPNKNQGTNLDFTAVLDGHEFVFAPVEPVGLRYLQIEHAPMPITAQNCRLIARGSRMDTSLSSFRSSDSTLNAVWGLMKHTLTVCAQEQYLDTPTREKGSFLGDSIWQSFAAMPVMGERVLTRRVLGEYLQSMDQFWRQPADRGRVNAVYPNGDGARDIPDNTQTYLLWVWEYYQQTGDREFLRQHYTHLRDIADHVHRARDGSTGLVTDLPGGDGQYQHGIIDWPPSMRFGYDVGTAARTFINFLAWVDFDIIARIAAELGLAADVDTYRSRADALKEAINGRLLTKAGVYCDGLYKDGTVSSHVSQHANNLPLALGLVPAAQRPAVIAKVKELKMSVGMETVWWLIRALGESDQGDQLLELFTNESWPGWARCLARGATTTWESWFADEERKTDSLSHGWGAVGLRGYTDYILGVQPLRPQFEQVQIKPLDFGTRLQEAGGRVPTDRGVITVDWERNATRFLLRVNLPPNVTANVYVPAGGHRDPVVKVDGADVTGTLNGNYLCVPDIGSGVHVFERVFARPGNGEDHRAMK